MDASAIRRKDIAAARKIFVNRSAGLRRDGDPESICLRGAAELLPAFAFPPTIAGGPIACGAIAVESRCREFEHNRRALPSALRKDFGVVDVRTNRDAECRFAGAKYRYFPPRC